MVYKLDVVPDPSLLDGATVPTGFLVGIGVAIVIAVVAVIVVTWKRKK